ncbi:MAG TPA: NAD(P)H-dependent glycerol-3-phosphate dehydrogenase [Syntrophorhabdaceae bacterium]|nr:NAD(P)H-dependent glycerol-3-phosphate dehydrogenase [Syntrophorhabdaceae bacterium]
MNDVSVIGAGAWGTAFALHLARTGKHVLLWVYEEELCQHMTLQRENRDYLPGFVLPDSIEFTSDLTSVARHSNDIVVVMPSFALRTTIGKISGDLAGTNVLVLTKGIERDIFLGMDEVIQQVVGKDVCRIGVLSGPSFAKEVAKGDFTASVIASHNKELAMYFQQSIHSETFRVYISDDVTGVEIGGALKNVMAIGTGIIEGLRLGMNTQAAFLTRALAEMKRLGKAMGATETTFMGLSGMGDLVLTSYGNLSRNRMFGIELAKGKTPADLIKSQKMVVEGYYSIDAAYNLSRRLGVSMPITEELYKIVYEGKEIRASFQDIIRREFKKEAD